MLGGKISNHDEEEVEQELEALENEIRNARQGLPTLPEAPSKILPGHEADIETEPEADREPQQPTRINQGEREAMLA